MSEVIVDADKFREVMGDVPELTTPHIFRTVDGQKIEWPFQTYKLAGKDGEERGILETDSYPGTPYIKGSRSLIRVEYEKPYGLAVSKWLHLEKINRNEVLLKSGRVRYELGELEVILGVNDDFILQPTEDSLKNPDLFTVWIGAYPSGCGNEEPALASVSYGASQRIPIWADYLYADYQNAVAGLVEKRDGGINCHPRYSYATTYFQWENLVGAKVGVSKFEDEKHDHLRFFAWPAKINDQELVPLDGTPYKSGISHLPDWTQFGLGRLRFHRTNAETGESWTFSVPEWIDKRKFMWDIVGRDFESFLNKYLVIFYVEKPGEETKLFAISL